MFTYAIKNSHLILEELESRLAPATYRWDPIPDYPYEGATADWTTLVKSFFGFIRESNWDKLNPTSGLWSRADSFPGEWDTAQFSGETKTLNQKCIIPTVTVENLNILDGYSKTLIVLGTLTVRDTLNLDSPFSAISGGTVLSNGFFVWEGGNLLKTTLTVNGKMTIKGDGARTIVSTNINVNNWAVWSSGDVRSTELSTITIGSEADFNIFSVNNILGSSPSTLNFINKGVVFVKSSGNATINGSYSNQGNTVINTGVLVLGGTAIQTKPFSSFQIQNGTTVKIDSKSGVLDINEGSIIGNGTIDGSLCLGAGGVSVPVMEPCGGSTLPQIGTLNITRDFHIYRGTLIIDIANLDLTGLTNKIINDLVLVSGKAILKGTVKGNIVQGTITGPAVAVFLKSSNIINDFTNKEPPGGWSYGHDNKNAWFLLPGPAGGVVGGLIYANNDGTNAPDANNPGIAGATVSFYDGNNNLVESATTASDGSFSLTNLSAGTFSVVITVPSGYVLNGSSN